MVPFFFGRQDGRLFGVYHPPQLHPAGSEGVVICPSFGHEYVRAHRALRNLAATLARQGFPVLRFDYYGCGDSGGEAQDTTLERCIADAASAATELRERSGAPRVVFVGHRFGAAVAMLASARRPDVKGALLWDPVVRGSVYLQELLSLHSTWMQVGGRSAADDPGERDAVLGFALSPLLRAELATVDLMSSIESWPATAALHVIVSEQTAESPALFNHVTSKYGPTAWRLLDEPAAWGHPASIHTALAAPQALQSISAWLKSATSPRNR